jgi:hypothetical protein
MRVKNGGFFEMLAILKQVVKRLVVDVRIRREINLAEFENFNEIVSFSLL